MVGSLQNNVQAEKFNTFITKRCLSAGVSVVVHSVKLFSTGGSMSARIVVSANGAKLVKTYVFWQHLYPAERRALIRTGTVTVHRQSVSSPNMPT